MKTERIEFVAPPGLKSQLQKEAAKAKISVGELIRQRFVPNDEERELAKLTAELKKSVAEARRELAVAADSLESIITELQARRRESEQKAA